MVRLTTQELATVELVTAGAENTHLHLGNYLSRYHPICQDQPFWLRGLKMRRNASSKAAFPRKWLLVRVSIALARFSVNYMANVCIT